MFKNLELSTADRLWLTEINKELNPDIKKIKARLWGKLPRDFDQKSIDQRLHRGNRLTLLGIWYLDPQNPIFDCVTRVIQRIRQKILDTGDVQEVGASDLGQELGIETRLVAESFCFMSDVGSFWSSASGNDKERGFSLINLSGDNAYDDYLSFENVEELLENFFLRYQPVAANKNASIAQHPEHLMTSIPDGRTASPVLLPRIQKLFQDELQRIETEQITPWIMGFATGKLNIHYFNKKQISYSGIAFEGSPQQVFWGRYIEPFLEDFISSAIEQITRECSENSLDIEIELKCLEDHLRTLISSTFDKMAKAEQRMLGKGYPEQIPKRNVDIYINAMNHYLRQHIAMEIVKYISRKKNDAVVERDGEFVELRDPKHANRIARWEGIGVDAIRADLNSTGTKYVGSFANQQLAWKWIKSKEKQKEKIGDHKNKNIEAIVPSISIDEILKAGENDKLEYKSTFQWDIKNNKKSDDVRKSALKTIAAFLNTKGGTLVIGIADDKTITGLDYDLPHVKDKSIDGFELAFRDIFDSAIGVNFANNCNVKFEVMDEKTVCIIYVVQSNEPVFLSSGEKEEFYIRRGNSSKALTPKEQHEYIRLHF